MRQSGPFELITGPMYSGKTSRIGTLAYINTKKGRNVVMVDADCNTRHKDNEVKTHDGITFKSIKYTEFVKNKKNWKTYDIIIFDEVQFMTEVINKLTIVDTIKKLKRMGKIIYAAGLSGSYIQKPMGLVSELSCIANKHTHLYAHCDKCPSPYAQCSYLINIVPKDKEDNKPIIGGKKKYTVLCDTCAIWVGAV